MNTRPSTVRRFAPSFLALALGLAAVPARADLVLETETAELGTKGTMLFSTGIQLERNNKGDKGYFTLNQFEYAITDRAEILIEPFFHQWEKVKGEPSVSGMGDLEVTPSYMIIEEKPDVPAVVLAMKVKVPTAKNRDIGTGKFDYQPYVIIGKKAGPFIFNLNLGYDIVGKVEGKGLKNQFIYDFSVEEEITPKWSVYEEIFGNSKASGEEKAAFAGAIATEYRFDKHWAAFVSIGYDSDKVVAIRPGFNVEF